jgi:hypothetical protein
MCKGVKKQYKDDVTNVYVNMSDSDEKLMEKIIHNLGNIYVNVGAPLTFLATMVGLGSSIIGEMEKPTPNQPLTVFVNITGSTFLGIMSGLFWPVTMPVLSMGAIYNKMFR